MKTNASLCFTAILFLFLLCNCSIRVVKGNGDIITETISASDFDQIELEGGNMAITYMQSTDSPEVTLRTDKNIFELLVFEVKNNTLVIKPKPEAKMTNLSATEFTIVARSSMLKKLSMGGSMTADINGPFVSDELDIFLAGSGVVNLNDSTTVEDFDINMAGSGRLNAQKLFCKDLNSEIAGSGKMNLAGQAGKVSYEIAGSGNVCAFDFIVDEMSCEIAGSGEMEVHVNKLIKVDLAGSGSIKYKGEATVEAESFALKSIEKVD